MDDRAEGAAAGAGIGATLGGAAGLLAGLGLLAIPGIGPVVAAGWLAATAAGAAAGGATGGIIGALSQAGIGKDDAQVYAEGVRRGGTLVTVRAADGDRARVEAILDRNAVNIRDRGAAYRNSGWKSFDPKASRLYGRPGSCRAQPLSTHGGVDVGGAPSRGRLTSEGRPFRGSAHEEMRRG